ncbi:MAG: AAA family ATPase [Gemmatimonadales bacterium]
MILAYHLRTVIATRLHMSNATYHLNCLGVPELRTSDGRVVRIRVKKHMALLVFLAVERRQAHERSRLVELLWPGVPSDRGRHSCATALSLLRGIFGRAALPTVHKAVRFAPASLHLDLDILDSGPLFGTEGDVLVEVDGFLRGFDVDDAPEFSLWKEREQSRRLPTIHSGLLTLIDHARRLGSHDEIMARADRLLAIDYLAEEGVRAKMEALALVGDRVSALRVFDAWKDRLHREVGAEPSVIVEGMASQLRKRTWEPRATHPAPVVPTEQWRDRLFVGRRSEYRRLYEAWEEAKHFRPRHVVVTGDSGVGKTTLLQRLATSASLETASVSRVQCYPLEQRIPFAALGSLITGLLNRPGANASAPTSLAELATVSPAIHEQFAALPLPRPRHGEAARIALAEAAIDFTEAVVNERPLLLVIDDLQFIDEASAAVLHFVLRRLTSNRLMVAATLRQDQGTPLHVTRLLWDSSPARSERIELPPMTQDESGELLDSILELPTRPSLPERRALIAASRGYPMALELLAEDWRSNGADSLALALRAITVDLTLDAVGGSDNALSRIVDRLSTDLSPATSQVLTLAAVVGPHLDDPTIFEAIDLTASQALEGIADLVGRRVLRDVGNGVEFVNDLLRALVYRRIPTATRLRLHSAVADRSLVGSLRLSDLEAAWHLMRARRQSEAGPFLLRGARVAIARGASDDVVLAIRTSLPDLPGDFTRESTTLLGQAYLELGRWKEALSAADRARPQSGEARLVELEARWRLGTLVGSELESSIDELLDLAAASIEPARCLALAAFMAGNLVDETRLGRISEIAVGCTTNNEIEQARLLAARATAAYYLRQLSFAEDLARQALDRLASENVADSFAVQLRLGLGVILCSQGAYDKACDEVGAAERMAGRIGNDQLAYRAAANKCLPMLRLGDFRHVISTASRLVNNQVFSVNPTLRVQAANVAYTLACALCLQDRPSDALALLAQHALGPYERSSWQAQFAALYRSDILWLAGRRSQARTEARTAVGPRTPAASRGIVGSYWRWASVLWNTAEADPMTPRLAEAYRNRHQYDVIDRLEVSLAAASVGDGVVPAADSPAVQTRRLAGQLPPATVMFLERFY